MLGIQCGYMDKMAPGNDQIPLQSAAVDDEYVTHSRPGVGEDISEIRDSKGLCISCLGLLT